jgi:hypothetical protein
VFLRYLLLATGIWPPRHLLCVILTKSLPPLLLKSCQSCVMPPVHGIAALKVLRGVEVSEARSSPNLAAILAFLAFLALLRGTLSQSCL